MQIKRWLKSIGMGVVKNGWGKSGDASLKLTVSEEWIDGITYFNMFIQIHKN